MSVPSQDVVKFTVIIPMLSVWVTLKQPAGGLVAFSSKVAPATNVPAPSSQRTGMEFRNRPFWMFNSSDVEASGTHASSRAKTHPTAAPEIQKEPMLITKRSIVLSVVR